jgi:hypothetical protein
MIEGAFRPPPRTRGYVAHPTHACAISPDRGELDGASPIQTLPSHRVLWCSIETT